MRFDLHLHTTRYSPDSQMDPLVMLQRAALVGLHGIVITEHDILWPEGELDELRAAAPALVVLAGMEVTAREGHFLAYGVGDVREIARGMRAADLCREVHRQGGAVVAAHPYRWGQDFDDIVNRKRPDLDGLELMSSNMDAHCREKAALIWREHALAGLGCSDAHHEDVLGCCYTDFDVDIRNNRDLIDAIRGRHLAARERPPGDAG